MLSGVRFGPATVAGLACFFVAGCTTVVMREPAAVVATEAERSDLLTAAGAVAETKWPKPDTAAGLAGMLGGDVRVTEEDSVEAYLAALGQGPGRGVAVLRDAYVHIDAAQRLATAAERAAARAQPTDEDVRLVETAIGDLRGARDIYLASLRELGGEGDGVEPRTEQSLKAAFNEAIRSIGEAADTLSDRVAEKRLEVNAAQRVLPFHAAHFSGN